MRFLSPSTWLAAAAAALLVVLPFQSQFRPDAGGFALEVSASSTQAGHIQIFFDPGAGFSEANSTLIPLRASAGPAVYRLALTQGDFTNFRLDPIDRDGTVVLQSVKVVNAEGDTIRDLPLGDFHPNGEVQSLRLTPRGLEVVVPPGKYDPQLYLAAASPVSLHISSRAMILRWLRSAAWAFAVLILACWALGRAAGFRGRMSRLGDWLRTHPVRSVMLAGAVGVALSSYPLIFLGKSLVSPNVGTQLLYDEFPTLPGYSDSRMVDVRGSDVGAIMWQQVPYTAIQHRSIFWNFELPLWNRDNAGGTPLLGQGQSMLGDPLHWLVIAANSASWAWDLKYLLAKWLLAAGLGLSVWTLVRHRGAAMLVAAAAPFCGFFIYRVNHPAIFSFCYAPWIIYCWLRIATAVRLRPMAMATAGLVAANWIELNSGTVKEAYVLLGSLNLVGGLMLLCAPRPGRWRLGQLAALLGTGVLFLGLTSPFWYTFLDALRVGSTASDIPNAWQIQPSLLIGLFDEAFYRPLSAGLLVFNPSANFLLLAGVLYFLASLREQFANRLSLALALGCLVPLAFAFGLIPPAWIDSLPFLGRIQHVDDAFSCTLILLSAILAGAGFAAADRRLRAAPGASDLWIGGAILLAMLWAYFGFGQAVHKSIFGDLVATETVWHPGHSLPFGAFVLGYLCSLLAALVIGAVLLRAALRSGGLSPAVAMGLTVCALALVWRGGEWAGNSSWPSYGFRPPERINLRARSGAEKYLENSARRAPVRSIGLQGNFFPGWTAMYGLEGINGPDAVANPYYRQLTDASALTRIWDWRLYLSRDNLAAARPFLDMLNVRHYLDLRSDQGLLGAVLKLDRPGDLDVYESPTVWPRAFFSDRLVAYGNAADFVRRLPGSAPFAAIQPGELGPDSALAPLLRKTGPGRFSPASGYHLTENSTSFVVDAPTAGVAVLTETFWAGYPHVRVDGAPAPAVRVNQAFIGIPVTAGRHRITVRYRPRYFNTTLLIAGLSALLMGAAFAAAWRNDPIPPTA